MNFIIAQRSFRQLALISMMAVVIAACGPSTPPNSAATATPSPITPTAVAAEENSTQATEESNSDGANSAAEEAPTAEAESEPVTELPVNPKINLNDMTEDELLTTIPDFSSRMVREFFEYQPYVSIQQFRREIGKYVDDEQVAAYEQYVYVPVDVNESDAETLKQLPGVDNTIAEVLLTIRPYESNAMFLQQLAEYVSTDDLAAAAGYLAE